jgi:uncharacterized Zn finger protein
MRNGLETPCCRNFLLSCMNSDATAGQLAASQFSNPNGRLSSEKSLWKSALARGCWTRSVKQRLAQKGRGGRPRELGPSDAIDTVRTDYLRPTGSGRKREVCSRLLTRYIRRSDVSALQPSGCLAIDRPQAALIFWSSTLLSKSVYW